MASSHPLQRLMRYSRKYRRDVWLASICSVLNKFFDLAPPVLDGLAGWALQGFAVSFWC